MCGNTFLPVTYKAYVPQYQLLLQQTAFTTESVNYMTHNIAIGKLYIIRV